ncbi:MAG: hypothetical protein DMG57_28220 [Acidobacteria bacterium]|nr:MAG: hypothetical protein DMG57_28220 [Acidobacteriota bacterium]
MFWRFVVGAVKFRRRRLALAFAGLAVAAMLATAVFSLYSDIERKMRREFRAFGANLVIAPVGDARTVPLQAVSSAEKLDVVAAPFIYTIGRITIGHISDERVVEAGVDFSRAGPLISYWRVEGARTASKGECLAGITLAAHFRVALAQTVTLASGPCTVRGIVSTGGAEDSQVIVPFERASADAAFRDVASLVQIRADGERLPEVRDALSRAFPQAEVRVLRALAETEANVVMKVRSAVLLLSVVILLITTLCVTGNFSELVLERSKEIGVLKAIGAAEGRIATLLLSESLVLALAAALTGYAAGLAIAYWIGLTIFSNSAQATPIGVDFAVFMPVALMTLLIAAVATVAAASRIWRIEPAVILRGE